MCIQKWMGAGCAWGTWKRRLRSKSAVHEPRSTSFSGCVPTTQFWAVAALASSKITALQPLKFSFGCCHTDLVSLCGFEFWCALPPETKQAKSSQAEACATEKFLSTAARRVRL